MNRVNILDHGYIGVVEHWGSDERIIEAARMSTGKGFLGWEPGQCPTCNGVGHKTEREYGWNGSEYHDVPCNDCGGTGKIPGDFGLLRRLWVKKHATPFEMAGMIVEVQAPIMVFREWHRHRIQSIVEDGLDMPEMSFNEMSARYTPLPDVNYIPSVERLMMNQGTKNRQAGTVKDAEILTEEQAESFRLRLQTQYMLDQELYEWALKSGVPKELARIHLPVGRYSRMRASANLRNWLAFLTLRMSEDAQWEIRVYATALHVMLKEKFPRTLELFDGTFAGAAIASTV